MSTRHHAITHARRGGIFILSLVLAAGLGLSACDHGHDHEKDHKHDEHAGHDHDHSGPNPHLWLDPMSAHAFVSAMEQPLARIAGDEPTIVVSIPPVASLISEIVGEDATVHTLLTPGASPHGFEPTPAQLAQLTKADLLISIGQGLDAWADSAAKKVAPDVPAVHFYDLAKGKGDKTGEAIPLPTAWQERRDALLDKLKALDAKYKSTLANVKQKHLVTYHDAFDPLAERYGLEVVAHLMPFDLAPGEDVAPARLAGVIKAIKAHKLEVFYAEPQMPEQAVRVLTEETGVKVLRLDPLGDPAAEGYRTYFELMESNLATLKRGQSME